MTTTASNKTTYHIEAGEYGGVIILDRKGNPIAEMQKKTVMRSCSREGRERMEGWIGFNLWSWYGIMVKSLPHGVTVQDVAESYMIARDEMMDAGFELKAGEQ